MRTKNILPRLSLPRSRVSSAPLPRDQRALFYISSVRSYVPYQEAASQSEIPPALPTHVLFDSPTPPSPSIASTHVDSSEEPCRPITVRHQLPPWRYVLMPRFLGGPSTRSSAKRRRSPVLLSGNELPDTATRNRASSFASSTLCAHFADLSWAINEAFGQAPARRDRLPSVDGR
jgi:hypothetical protein